MAMPGLAAVAGLIAEETQAQMVGVQMLTSKPRLDALRAARFELFQVDLRELGVSLLEVGTGDDDLRVEPGLIVVGEGGQ